MVGTSQSRGYSFGVAIPQWDVVEARDACFMADRELPYSER